MRDLYLLRHTAVDVPEGLCYGDSDVPLADTAEDDINSALARLPASARQAPHIISSPSGRCARLARALSASASTDARLKEFNFGAWEGQRWQHIPALQIALWSANVVNVRTPGGENLRDVANRASACVQAALAQTDDTIVLVTHGGVIRALIAELVKIPLDTITRFNIGFGRSTCVRLHPQHAELQYVNR